MRTFKSAETDLQVLGILKTLTRKTSRSMRFMLRDRLNTRSEQPDSLEESDRRFPLTIPTFGILPGVLTLEFKSKLSRVRTVFRISIRLALLQEVSPDLTRLLAEAEVLHYTSSSLSLEQRTLTLYPEPEVAVTINYFK
jgi:hypothetical protein